MFPDQSGHDESFVSVAMKLPNIACLYLSLLLFVLANCSTTGSLSDVCSNSDGALSDASFVIVSSPHSGERVQSGFGVTGCSRTFEGNVQWRLLGRNGAALASGFTNGGGVDGAGSFDFAVTYSVPERQIGHLEVYEEDVSDGEGFPPGRNVVPLVLNP